MEDGKGEVLDDEASDEGLAGDHVVVDLHPPRPQVVTNLPPAGVPWEDLKNDGEDIGHH